MSFAIPVPLPRSAVDVIIQGSLGTTVFVEAKYGMSFAVETLMSERVRLREQLKVYEAVIETSHLEWARSNQVSPWILQEAHLARLAHQRQLAHDSIALLRECLHLIGSLIRLAVQRSRSWFARTQLFLSEHAWFLYHGDHPPRYAPVASGVLIGLGRMCSTPATA